MTTEYYVEDQQYTSLSNLLSDGWPDDAVVHIYPGRCLESTSNVGKLRATVRPSALERDTAVLARHWRASSGLTYGSPDRCACGVETRPARGDDDVSDRRALAFAAHQAAMLAEARNA